MKILLIDDETDLVETLQTILQSHKLEADVAFTGEDGLNMLSENHYDLVITDKKMGRISGLEIINYIEDNSPNTPIFLITGDNVEKVPFKNPVSRLYKKPAQIEEILEAINEITN